MLKKLLLPIVILGMVFFVQCSDDQVSPDQSMYKAGKGGGNGGGGGGGGGGEEETAGNNLSFPVFALDGITINPVTSPVFSFAYLGDYPGLTDDEIQWLEENGPWYAQKVENNLWQAEYVNANEDVHVTFIDWGDVLEVVNPKMGRPTRIEVTLYIHLGGEDEDPALDGYTMALLEYPSSPNEVQGTNTTTYSSVWATVASASTNMIVQHLENGATPTWNDETDMWEGEGVGMPTGNFGFGPELNVGGKYIFGASSGGWRPQAIGVYRLTFYMDSNSSFIHLEDAVIGNYLGNGPYGAPENTTAAAIVDSDNNLTYIDVTVVTGGGGGGGGKH